MAWSIRPYREGDVPGMLGVFEAGGFAGVSEARFRWQVLSRPCAAPTAWVPEADGWIVGTYCGTPLLLRLCGAEAPGIHGSHAMTLPAFRRQGILTALASAAQDAWAAAGYRLQIGVPWGTWGSRRAALGWVPVVGLVWVQRWLRPEHALARRLGMPAWVPLPRLWDRLAPRPAADASLHVRVLAEPVSGLDSVWSAAAPAWEHAVVRDAAWLGWRYFDVPDSPYRVLLGQADGQARGYVVVKLGGVRGWIVDLLATSMPDHQALVQAGLSYLRAAGVERISALVAPGSPAQRALGSAGFRGGQGGEFAVVPLDRSLPLADVTRRDSWLIAGGDFDVV